MKRKGLIITTILFFLTVNTNYYWEAKLGILAFPVFLLFVVVYLVLAICLITQIYSAIKEKFKDRRRLFDITLLTVVLALTFLFPGGLVNFDRLEGKDLLTAEREGSANCMTTFKLKQNHTFSEKSVCFGVSETKGNYELKGDTIFFTNVTFGRGEKEYYKFAVIKHSDNKNRPSDLIRYKNDADTTGQELSITKNELTK